MKTNEKTLKNFIKRVKFNNVMCALGKVVTFLIVEVAICNIGLYIVNNCITTIK